MRYVFALLFVAMSFLAANGQCPAGDVNLTTQTEVNNFPPTCLNLAGSLSINDLAIDPIVDLNPLINLAIVGGSLSIDGNPALLSLIGLDSLNTVGGNLAINSNSGLSSLIGLDSLSTVVGSLSIDDNSSLLNVIGLDSLKSVGGDLNISDNPVLFTLEGLSSLTTVGGALNIFNSGILSLAGLDSLVFIGGDLNIDGTEIVTVNGLNNLASVPFGSISIGNNPDLVTVDGWDSLTFVGNGFRIQNNPVLLSVIGLDSLSNVGGAFIIQNNPVLFNLNGLANLSTIGGGILATNNSSLSDCCVFFSYLNSGGSGSFLNNLMGCNSSNQIIANCAPIPPALVPTMSEWGLILLVLLTLNFGILFMKYPRYKLANSFGTISLGSTFSSLPFHGKTFGLILMATSIFLVAGFAIAIVVFGYSLTSSDIPGLLICTPVISYLIYQIVRKE